MALLLGLAACWSNPKPEPVTATTAPPKPVRCPSETELAAMAKTLWGSEIAEGSMMGVLCVPLRRNGKVHFWLEGPAPKTEKESFYVPTGRALLDERHAVVWKGGEGGDSFGYMYNGGGEAADLDGDGNDEVLYRRTTGEGGMTRTELIVVTFAAPPTAKSIILDMGRAGENTCDGSYSLLPHGRGKLIDVTRKGNSCGDSMKAHQRYDAQGNELP